MNKWDNLSMRERAELIKIGVLNGITDLLFMRNYYNSYSQGGNLKEKNYVEDINNENILTNNNFSNNDSFIAQKLNNFINRYLYNILNTQIEDTNKYSIPKDNPERIFSKKVNEKNSKVKDEILIKELYSKTPEEIAIIQKLLADKGAFDEDLSKNRSLQNRKIQRILYNNNYLKSNSDIDGIIGKNSTRALLEMLVDQGYLNPTTLSGNSNIDGIMGKRTREAYQKYNRDRNIDGILGKKTIKAYLSNYKNKSNAFNINVSAEGMVDLCARWVSKKFDTVTGASKLNGVYGNAWTMLKNVENAGGELIYNIYDNPEFNNLTTSKELKNTTELSLKKNPLDYSKVLPGDIVGIYNPSSTHHKDVLESGTTYNTHVGIVVDVEDGIPIIEHNILGKVRREKINKLTGSIFGKPAVTAVSRPKYEGLVDLLTFDNNIKSKYIIEGERINPLMKEYMNSLSQSKEAFKDIYPNVDLDFIEKVAIAITKRETGFMNNKQSDLPFRPANIARKVAHFLKDTPEEIISLDLTKMKFNSLAPIYRAAIGLQNPEQLSTDPTITGRAVMLLLAKNYDYFLRLSNLNKSLHLNKEDIENATIKSYNSGLRSLSSLGFDAKTGKANFNEIKELRKESNIGAKEKNINVTNYKYLGGIGDWLYNNIEDPHITYVAAARDVMKNKIKHI